MSPSPKYNPAKLKRSIYGHLALFLIGLIGVIFVLYQGLSLLSSMHPHATQPTILNIDRKQSIIDIHRFMYHGDVEHYRASATKLTALINFRDAMGQVLFKSNIPLTTEQSEHIMYYNHKVADNAAVAQLYVSTMVGFERGLEIWTETTQILVKQRALIKEIYDTHSNGGLQESQIIAYQNQLQQLDDAYTDKVKILIRSMAIANDKIRYFVFGIVSLLAITITIFAERVTRSRLRYTSEFIRYEQINEHYRKFPESNPYPIFSFDKNGELTYFNVAAEKSFPNLNVLTEHHPFVKAMLHRFSNENSNGKEIDYRHVEYNSKNYDVMLRSVGGDQGFHVYVFDSSLIYEQKRKIEENLQEKEILIREIHHRVNNNLAIILGFLELSEQQMQDTTCRRLNDLNMTRIRTVSVINRALYEHGDFTNVDFTGHLTHLQRTNHLQVSYETTDRMILNVNQAFSLSLLLNEIVQELRYAGCCKDLHLKVSLTDDEIRMTISSNELNHFNVPDNEIMQLMISQLGVTWSGYDSATHSFSFNFAVREVSGAIATTHLNNGVS
jgi:two-component sensor histidine kinase